MRKLLHIAIAILAALAGTPAGAQDEPEEARFRVLGLFMKERIEAFKKEIAKVDDIELVELDYESGEATLRLHGSLRLKNGKPENRLRGLSERVRHESKGAFEIVPPQEKPVADREKIEIAIKGHDCLGCSFGAYRAVYKMEGVHRVTADFGEGLLTAWIDPGKTDRAALEETLVKKKVILEGQGGE